MKFLWATSTGTGGIDRNCLSTTMPRVKYDRSDTASLYSSDENDKGGEGALAISGSQLEDAKGDGKSSGDMMGE